MKIEGNTDVHLLETPLVLDYKSMPQATLRDASTVYESGLQG